MAMMHLLWNCLNGNKSQKKMFFKIHIIYIDEAQTVFGTTEEESLRRRNLIIELCAKYGFQYTIVPIEKAYEINRPLLMEPSAEMEGEKYKKFHE